MQMEVNEMRREISFDEIKNSDLPIVMEIYNHYVLNTTATFHSRALTLEEMKELVFFENPKYKTFVIKYFKEIYGYVILAEHKKREAYDGTAEVTVYLRTKCIGKGIGTKALKHIEEYAKTNNIHVLIATICGANEKSIDIFIRNGYEKCAHYKETGRKFGQLLDVVAYQKIIN